LLEPALLRFENIFDERLASPLEVEQPEVVPELMPLEGIPSNSSVPLPLQLHKPLDDPSPVRLIRPFRMWPHLAPEVLCLYLRPFPLRHPPPLHHVGGAVFF
jgi:hypothetical protein